MSPFPLLRLPQVPLFDILQLWNLMELFNLSMISKRACSLVKKVRNTNRKVLLISEQSVKLREYQTTSNTEKVFFIYIHKTCIECTTYKGSLNGLRMSSFYHYSMRPGKLQYSFRFENGSIALLEVVKRLTTLFSNTVIVDVVFFAVNWNEPLFDYIQKELRIAEKKYFDITILAENYLSDEKMTRVVEKLKTMEYCIFESDHHSTFKYDFYESFERMHYLEFRNAKWLNFSHLMWLRNETMALTLKFTSISAEDLNKFLIYWQNDPEQKETKLKHISVNDSCVKLDRVLRGISFSPSVNMPAIFTR
uniref:F-box domain-containing protein n=1 Tax=Caenorhabditis tropicalis TaxID=1561998 RepID=A0A1I7SXF1_9PELO